MIKNLETLCNFNAPSGSEQGLRDYILTQISPFADCKIDNAGNIIAFKKGNKTPKHRVVLDAHLDEVGFIISAITPEGFLKFQTVGGITDPVLLCKNVIINNKINGVIGCKPIHLTDSDEAKKCPKSDAMYIDIGAGSKQEAEKVVSVGDYGVICGEFEILGNNIKSKALDDRIGCAVLIELIKTYNEFDFYATFTVLEEVGSRGAKVAAFSVEPDFAIVLEATTAADIDGSDETNRVCVLGGGPAISFMDNGTMYNRSLFNAANKSSVPHQIKTAVAGGNNSAAIHLSGNGVKTLAVSVPCRYIHSPACVANINDIENTLNLTRELLTNICSGEI